MTILNSEQKYQHLVENSLQGVVIIQGFKIVYSNPAFARTFGYTVNDLLALEPTQIINLVHPMIKFPFGQISEKEWLALNFLQIINLRDDQRW